MLTASASERPGPARDFLPHVEGLRGVAVLAVVWYHVGLPGMTGGFTGVDVFFVLSGFLITGLLLREHERTGRIDLGHFYSRRVRRILPAALATVAVTTAAAALLLAPLDVASVAQDGAASALSIGNLRFAAQSTDYFADLNPSPFRHFWSLGVEEQFYLIWPALLILALRAVRSRLWLATLIGAVLLSSFAFALWLTDALAPWAFYSLPSRVWQLALGGLLAVGAGWLASLPDRLIRPVGWLGLGALVMAFVVVDPTTPYPGTAALLPALGAAALVVAGGRGRAMGALLTCSPLRFFGRISYSLYLWHWPILVLPALAIGEPLPLETRCALAGASVLVAAASWQFIEEPFRRGRLSTFRPRPVLAAAVGTALATAVLAVGIGDVSLRQVDALGGESSISVASEMAGGALPSGGLDATEPLATPVSMPPPVETAAATTVVPPAMSSSSSAAEETVPAATPLATPTAVRVKSPWSLPAGIRPALSRARSDSERPIADGCFIGLQGSRLPDCTYGNPNGMFTVALVGDSHASHWFPALERVVKERGWRLLVFVKASCVFLDMRIYSPFLKREYTECETWRPLVVQRLIAERPDLVIVSSDRWLPTMVKGDDDPVRQGQAMARLISQIPGRIAILADTPASRFDVPACLSRNLADITRCATPRSEAFGGQPLVRERAAVKATGATLVDLSNAVCRGDPCQAVVGNMIVYRDDHHLTATFALSLAGALEMALPIPR